MSEEILLKNNERIDDLLYRERRIIQSADEFCFSIDAVLLAHFLCLSKRERLLDLGTGTGVIPLLACDSVKSVSAIELNPVMADMAKRSVALNSLQGKIEIVEGDYRRIEDYFVRESFDVVLANPPYRAIGSGELSGLKGVASARHELTATLIDTVSAARKMLRFRGRFGLVHLPERLGEIIVALHENKLEVKRLQFVQPKSAKAPNIVLVEAVYGASPGGMKALPPLIVHNDDGTYTKEILRIYGEKV